MKGLIVWIVLGYLFSICSITYGVITVLESKIVTPEQLETIILLHGLNLQ